MCFIPLLNDGIFLKSPQIHLAFVTMKGYFQMGSWAGSLPSTA